MVASLKFLQGPRSFAILSCHYYLALISPSNPFSLNLLIFCELINVFYIFKVSEISIDSHLCPSEASDTPTYHDVINDVTSQKMDTHKSFERKQNRSLKHKSKSDPSGAKQKQLEGVDLPSVIAAQHAQSMSALSKDKGHVPKLLEPEFSHSKESKVISKSDNILSSRHVQSPRLARLRESPLTRSTSEESSEDAQFPLQRQAKPRKISKKRRTGLSTEAMLQRDSSREGDDETPPHPATEPSTPTLSPESTLSRLKAKTTLTLPLPGKRTTTGVSRSHSSAVDYGKGALHKPDYLSGASPNTFGARPKDLPSAGKVRDRKGRPPIPEPLTRGVTLGWSPSDNRATYSPRLDTIFSGSTFSLFEDREDMVCICIL